MHKVYDTVIIGGGIAGASLGYFLSPHQSVLILERESQCGYHSTGRSAAEYTERFHSFMTGILTKASYEFLTNPPKGFSEVDLLIRRGNLVIADEEKATHLLETYEAECEKSPGLVLLTKEQAIERAPILNSDYIAAAFYDPDCWEIEVENLLQGYLKGAKSAGAKIEEKNEVLSIVKQNFGWTITTSNGEFHAKKIVNCAGAWADEIAKIAGLSPLGLMPLRRTVITVDADKDIDISNLPGINEIDDTFYFKPEGGKIMSSPADETQSSPCDAQPEDIDVAYAAHYLQISTKIDVSKISHKWAGLRTFSQDRNPVVGFSNECEGFFWLAGQGGFGIQTSAAMGRLATSLIVDGQIPDELSKMGLTEDVISPSRFSTTC